MTISKELLISMSGGICSEISFLTTGYLLDNVINTDVSNFIGLIIGGIINFIFQKGAFLNNSLTYLIIIKYLIVDLILYAYLEFSYIYFENKIHKVNKAIVNHTTLRIILSIIGFIFISFPLRKYFAFS